MLEEVRGQRAGDCISQKNIHTIVCSYLYSFDICFFDCIFSKVHYHEMPLSASPSTATATPASKGAAAAATALAAPHIAGWQDIWTAQWNVGASSVMVTPEYGPSPYTPPSTLSLPTSSCFLSEAEKGAPAAPADVLWAQTLAGAVHLREVHALWGKKINARVVLF